MKTIEVYEFKDLDKKIALEVWKRSVDESIELAINDLTAAYEEEHITEEEYFENLGCSKHYAETTSWFVPSCYYDRHRSEILREVRSELEDELFTSWGMFIQHKD